MTDLSQSLLKFYTDTERSREEAAAPAAGLFAEVGRLHSSNSVLQFAHIPLLPYMKDASTWKFDDLPGGGPTQVSKEIERAITDMYRESDELKAVLRAADGAIEEEDARQWLNAKLQAWILGCSREPAGEACDKILTVVAAVKAHVLQNQQAYPEAVAFYLQAEIEGPPATAGEAAGSALQVLERLDFREFRAALERLAEEVFLSYTDGHRMAYRQLIRLISDHFNAQFRVRSGFIQRLMAAFGTIKYRGFKAGATSMVDVLSVGSSVPIFETIVKGLSSGAISGLRSLKRVIAVLINLFSETRVGFILAVVIGMSIANTHCESITNAEMVPNYNVLESMPSVKYMVDLILAPVARISSMAVDLMMYLLNYCNLSSLRGKIDRQLRSICKTSLGFYVNASSAFRSIAPPDDLGEVPNPSDPFDGELLLVSGRGTYLYAGARPRPLENTGAVNRYLDETFETSRLNEFGPMRYAYCFDQGEHEGLNVDVGYYTSVYGLSGRERSTVRFKGGIKVHNHPSVKIGALDNFWRSLENMEITPTSSPFKPEEGPSVLWVCSQASQLRNLSVLGSLHLSMWEAYGADLKRCEESRGQDCVFMPSSGGYMSNVHVDGNLYLGTQQQFMVVDSDWGGEIKGGAWSLVMQNAKHSRSLDLIGEYQADLDRPHAHPTPEPSPSFVQQQLGFDTSPPEKPVLRRRAEHRPGAPLTDAFCVEHKDGTIEDIVALWPSESQSLLQGAINKKNVLLLPGYHLLTDSIDIERDGAILMGVGYATIQSVPGFGATLRVNAVGVRVCGLMFQACEHATGQIEPGSTLLHVKQNRRASKDRPTVLQDVSCRCGGAKSISGRFQCESVETMVLVEQDHVCLDHLWLWRADHCGPLEDNGNREEAESIEAPGTLTARVRRGLGRDRAQCDHCLVVFGNDVTAYGLFAEHVLKECIVWCGDNGRIGFLQCELAYDVVGCARSSVKHCADGWDYPALLVGQGVSGFKGIGMGIYSFFTNKWTKWAKEYSTDAEDRECCVVSSAVSVPKSPEVQCQVFTRFLDPKNGCGGIGSLIGQYDGDGSVTYTGAGSIFVPEQTEEEYPVPWAAVNLERTGKAHLEADASNRAPESFRYKPVERWREVQKLRHASPGLEQYVLSDALRPLQAGKGR